MKYDPVLGKPTYRIVKCGDKYTVESVVEGWSFLGNRMNTFVNFVAEAGTEEEAKLIVAECERMV